MSDTQRQAALDLLAGETSLTGVTGLTQYGRDNDARFTITIDNQHVHLGTIDGLWSQTLFAKALAVGIGRLPLPVTPKVWHAIVAALITHAVDVKEAHGETWTDTVGDFLRSYIARSTPDREGSVPNGEPFIDDGTLYLTATEFAKTIRREHQEQVKLNDLRQALRDLGAQQKTLHYRRSDGSNSSVSYYAIELQAIDADAPASCQ